MIASLGPHEEAFAFSAASVNGSAGLADDYISLAADWDFALEEVIAKVNLFAGDGDPTVPLAVAQAMCSRLPLATLTIVPKAGHLLLYTHPEEVLDAAVTLS